MAKLTKKQTMFLADIVGALACAASYLDHPKDDKDVARARLHLSDAMSRLRGFINTPRVVTHGR